MSEETDARVDPDAETETLRLSGGERASAAPTVAGTARGAGEAAHRRLGPYEVLRELGRGAMGVVYLARDVTLGRTVALKVLPRRITEDSTALERFRREAAAAGKLAHPHIVGILGMGEEGGIHYYAMEAVEGRPLSEIIAKERITQERAALVAMQAARGIGHAHEKGVVHRDVKPANLLVSLRAVDMRERTPSRREKKAMTAASDSWAKSEGSSVLSLGLPKSPAKAESTRDEFREDYVRVADFGLARVEGGQTLTKTSDFLGTPAYMSPEQAAGERRKVGPASDVYSLGATLYEMLAGRRPFEAPDLPKIQSRAQRPRSPRTRLWQSEARDVAEPTWARRAMLIRRR
ncbi:MAG: serine/threonine protein kinase [Planctomycetes bacterium]|nr:serine/threonine protein kinase [Planctomycetota bacterium]